MLEANFRTKANDDIELYFVNFMYNGSHGSAFWYNGVADEKYADSVIISATSNKKFIIPHEIGHILLNDPTHPNDNLSPTKLMGTSLTQNDTVLVMKRLSLLEECAMLSARPNLLT